ncbi:MAG: hypothetical protein A3B25_02220 [Candidatus Ryanbacteria bacterium RIFCSPLOWO2_01_FULL_48_26]|uniref:Glycosyltransferase RgtA/B/C/D-like domain-containing protein n=1 Tax=Candidatus Ryanbacteria bacterium RIFCSPLOWO2_01_FULL_48_26 TaxID=1802126 RepID=A0A1G2GT88_9BACT|nr:MAG: hypothetical protein A3B25_02220 [Candidatus Ryanbacteria bacterium RIFCSPLOWO2_01_FULL_48_26]OHB23072.1 MAG: hypothetical protein A3J67_02140 [Parcubacteria group bacterium RIFCSPHIGHO2_02_FULL_48_10b]
MRLRDEFNGASATSAWNWLVHGPLEINFAMKTLVISSASPAELTRVFFFDHPSLFIAPTALIYWLLGVGEWQTRIVPILFSLLSLVVFWNLIARVFKTPWLTAASSFFYALFPMSFFYGSLFENTYFARFFILALFLAVITFEQERRRKDLIAICVITFIGGLADWPFLFAAAAAWWYILLTKNYPRKKLLLFSTIGTLAASLSLYMLQIQSIAHTNPIAIIAALFWNGTVMEVNSHSMYHFLNMRLNFDLIGFSEIGLILALIGTIFYLRDNKKDKAKIFFLLMFVAPGLLTYFIFHRHSTAHQFYGFYIVPAIALLAGYGLSRLRKTAHAALVALLFFISCAWYGSILFSYSEFAADDIALFGRANTLVPVSATICLAYPDMQFYLTPNRNVVDLPCPASSYFILRQPQSFANIYPLFNIQQTFQIDDFWQNARKISFSEAAFAEIIKSIPPLKNEIDLVLANRGPRNERIRAPKTAQAFIDEHKLKPLACSTNLCLYQRSEPAK